MTRTSKTMKGLLGASALALFASPAFAVGTAAGTSVDNTFSLTYSTGTATNTVDNTGSPTSFVVDRLINVNVTGGDTESGLPGATDQELLFTVVNTGNDEHEYLLTAENETGDQFDVSNFDFLYYLESTEATADGVCDGTGTTTTYDAAATTPVIPTVPADAVLCVIVQSDIDGSAGNGDSAVISLRAETADGTTPLNPPTTSPDNTLLGVENVFADTTGTFTGDNAGDGDHSASGTYTVGAATVTGSKSVKLVSQTGGCGTVIPSVAVAADTELMIPGACVEYTISAVNGGGSDADIDSLVDILPAELQLVNAVVSGFSTAGTLTFDGAASAPATPTDCNGTTNCEVELANAVLSDGATGVLTIHALVK